MSIFVYYRLERMFKYLRSSSKIPRTIEGLDVEGVIKPTPMIGNEPISAIPALDFELISLNDERVALSDYYGKPVMVNFWAIRCPPCLAVLPLIQNYAGIYEDEFVVLAINAGEEES